MSLYTVEQLKTNPQTFDLSNGGPAIIEWKNRNGRRHNAVILLVYEEGIAILGNEDVHESWRITPTDSGGDAIYLIPWEQIDQVYTEAEYTFGNSYIPFRASEH
jgi:hypothetical protein